jgi:branched-chain amino acid transport system permease protein
LIEYLLYVILPQLLHGLVWGTVIAFIALGLTIIFGIMDIVNFAHGEYYMLGAFMGYTVMSVIPNFWIAVPVAVASVALLGLFTEFVLFRRLYGREPIFHLLLTFGLGMMLRETAQLIWGGDTKRIEAPVAATIEILGAVYPVYRLIILGIGIFVILLIWHVLRRTEMGAKIRAVATDRTMAWALGIKVPLIYTAVFVGGVALAGFAGILMSPINFVYPTMGADVILRAFIVVVIGGLGSIIGALVASLMIGEIEALASIWISPTIAETLVFIILIATMIFKPSGLFGKSER